jgi:uncharacterized protein (TIGR03067 family)
VAELTGTWLTVSFVHDGKTPVGANVPPKEGPTTKLAYDGNKWMVKVEDKVVAKATSKIDSTKTPTEIDVMDESWMKSGETKLGIHEMCRASGRIAAGLARIGGYIMKNASLLVFVLFGALTAGPAEREANEKLVLQVRAAEIAFAATMAARDHEAFASHIADEALFFSKQGVLRGKAAVVAGWKPFFEGPKPPFSWAPERVEVLDSGTLALSSGPVRGPEGRQMGTFNSIWRREADGRWKVVFDKGCPACDCPPKP